MKHTREEQLAAFDRLLTIMSELRERCPWDRKQTFDSLRTNTIEEACELSDAILRHDMHEISKELGDVLLHVVFYAHMGSETGEFDIADVCNQLCDKLIFRHPHVYGEEKAQNAGEVSKLWEQVKQKEKDGNKTILSGIPESLPSLIKAYRMQDKARNAGFDWEQPQDVWEKVKEEISEVEEELCKPKTLELSNSGTLELTEGLEAEFGDLLFSLVNAARLYNVNPDTALERTNRKFKTRFTYIEQQAKAQGRTLNDLTLSEMETLWQEAKKSTKY